MSRHQDQKVSIFERMGIYMVVIALVIIGSFVSPNFFTGSNLLTVLNAVALLGIVATGMSFITYSGNMADLSLPSVMAFSGIITVSALPLGLPIAIILGIIAGMAIGAMNGFVVGRFNANPILWTLAVTFFMEGFMRYVCGAQVYPDTTPGSSGEVFIAIFRIDDKGLLLNYICLFVNKIFGTSYVISFEIPLVVIVMFAMFMISHFIMTRTRFGVESKLVGSSREAAAGSGINVKRVVLMDFLFAALAASVGGIFLASMNKLGVFYLGKGYDFKAVTAVVIGGMFLSGGHGSMINVLGGVLVIGLLANIMTFLGINTFQQNIVTGSIFILVVGIQQYSLRKQGKDHG